jgi:hypothetical protein
MQKTAFTNHPIPEASEKSQPELPGYPIYPPSEDVFNQLQRVDETSIEEGLEIEIPLEKNLPERRNSPDFTDDAADGIEMDSRSGELDVPGSELDDAMENIGSEDEENNYYSLGGDNHEDLEEDHSV